ncbi:hypothetical protein, partial [Pseudarthrobacter sp. NamB4]|uniref:hypothetical protein n=1 Tax=Pseudarthrobacter sp. NamB4 TaxID=2576837 RepID=UPI00197AED05
DGSSGWLSARDCAVGVDIEVILRKLRGYGLFLDGGEGGCMSLSCAVKPANSMLREITTAARIWGGNSRRPETKTVRKT